MKTLTTLYIEKKRSVKIEQKKPVLYIVRPPSRGVGTTKKIKFLSNFVNELKNVQEKIIHFSSISAFRLL